MKLVDIKLPSGLDRVVVISEPIVAKVTGVYLDHIKLSDDTKQDVSVKVGVYELLCNMKINTTYCFLCLETMADEIWVRGI